jgi:DNA-binding transcriptional regulator YiaG
LQFSAKALIAKREALGLSRMQLAARAGVSYFTIEGWEAYGRCPKATHFVALLDALDCDPHELVTENGTAR